MKNMFKRITKEKRMIYGVSLALFVVIITAVILGFSLQGKRNNLKKAIFSLDSYQIIIEAKKKEEELGSVLYRYDKETDLSYVSLRGLTADIEKQYYDRKNKMLYYQNIDTKQYQAIEFTTDYSFESQLTHIVDKKNEKSFFQPEKYRLPASYLQHQFSEQSNLMVTYLSSLGYYASDKDGTVLFSLQEGQLRKIILELPTTTEELVLTITFLPITEEITLPNVSTENKTNMVTTTQWIILYLQKLYAEEKQETKPVTDVSYLLGSKYKEELKGKISLQPIDFRLRIEPSTTKDTGVITGTITYEGNAVVKIENSAIIGK